MNRIFGRPAQNPLPRYTNENVNYIKLILTNVYGDKVPAGAIHTLKGDGFTPTLNASVDRAAIIDILGEPPEGEPPAHREALAAGQRHQEQIVQDEIAQNRINPPTQQPRRHLTKTEEKAMKKTEAAEREAAAKALENKRQQAINAFHRGKNIIAPLGVIGLPASYFLTSSLTEFAVAALLVLGVMAIVTHFTMLRQGHDLVLRGYDPDSLRKRE